MVREPLALDRRTFSQVEKVVKDAITDAIVDALRFAVALALLSAFFWWIQIWRGAD